MVWPDERWRNHRLTAEQVQVALQDGDPALAFLALNSCAVADRRAAIASSLQLLARLPDDCRRTVFAALRHLTGREMGLDLERWRSWWQAEGQYLDYSWESD